MKRRIGDLERALGRKALEGEILRKPLRSAAKILIAYAIAAGGGFPMKSVAETLGIALPTGLPGVGQCA